MSRKQSMSARSRAWSLAACFVLALFSLTLRAEVLPAGVCDGDQIRRAAGECLKRVPLTQKIRLLGVRAGALLPAVSSEPLRPVQAELPF